LHNGWLISGPKGTGKATLAWKIARFLLAEPAQDDGFFGESPPPPTSLEVSSDHPDARLMAAGAHPRFFTLRRAYDDKLKKLKSVITVDEVRKLKGFFGLSAADGGRRVVIVDAADEMNPNAANALLKLLEEPPAQATILLITHQPSRLLPTIRSRCRSLRCASLSPDAIASALTQAGFPTEESPALSALCAGSVGEAIRLLSLDGLPLYADIVRLFSGPRIDRPSALRLADSAAGARNVARFEMMLDLFDNVLARLARAGLSGPPEPQASSGEALLLANLSPDDFAARKWAQLQQDLSQRARHGRAVNLDPASLILDMIFKIEETARTTVSA
jgi:DNA polymerase-3 subunit delta'